jgi:branched-chain amino acid aminotransferase/4-amino-4-deoxychorismate lyase
VAGAAAPASAVPFDDRGLTLGDGLFETLLAVDGRLRDADAHLARLAAGCAALGLPAPDAAAALALMRDAVAGSAGRRAVRLTLTAGSGGRGLERPASPRLRMFAAAAPAPPPAGPARLVVSTVRRNAGSPAARLKTLAYLDNVLARREAQAAGADEALMLNGAGEVACAAAANVFWLKAGRLYTPALDCGVLAGVTRAAVIAEAARRGVPTEQVAAGLEAVRAAEAVFLTSSLVGVRAAASLDGWPLGSDPLTALLDAAVGA